MNTYLNKWLTYFYKIDKKTNHDINNLIIEENYKSQILEQEGAINNYKYDIEKISGQLHLENESSTQIIKIKDDNILKLKNEIVVFKLKNLIEKDNQFKSLNVSLLIDSTNNNNNKYNDSPSYFLRKVLISLEDPYLQDKTITDLINQDDQKTETRLIFEKLIDLKLINWKSSNKIPFFDQKIKNIQFEISFERKLNELTKHYYN